MSNQDRRQREREQMRENILEAATALFHEYGFDKVTIRRIADKIEYTPGIIYAYFKNKNEILYAIHQRGFDILYDLEMTVVKTRDPVERLVKLGQVYIQFALTHRSYYDLMFIESDIQQVISEEERWLEGQRAYGVLRDTLAECIQTGAMPPGDVDSVAFGIWAFVHGLVSLFVRGRCAMIPDKNIPVVLQAAYTYMYRALTGRRDIAAMLHAEAFRIAP